MKTYKEILEAKGYDDFVVNKKGDKEYFKGIKRHREDGPAVEMSNGTKKYYLNGTKYSKKDWEKEVKKLK